MKKLLTSFAVILLLSVGAFLFATSNFITGVQSFIVKSGSMEPAIPTGALVITRKTEPQSLRKGDVITFVEPFRTGEQFITHRIAGIDASNTFLTKGDSNWRSDNWEVAGDAIVGKVTLSLPYIGSLLAFLQSSAGILLFVFIPAAYLVLSQASILRKEIQSQ